jgi:hypothetical protein
MKTGGWICCQPLPASFPVKPPFGRFVSLGYYDGTTSGVAQCSDCSSTFRYELAAWDSRQNIRVYSIASLPRNSFDTVVKLLSAVDEPRWPFWYPKLSSEPSPLNVAIDAELSRVERPTYAVAAEHLEREILAGKEITATGLASLPKDQDFPNLADWDFWRAYLELDELGRPQR